MGEFDDVIKILMAIAAIMGLTKKTDPMEQLTNTMLFAAQMSILQATLGPLISTLAQQTAAINALNTALIDIIQIPQKLSEFSASIANINEIVNELQQTVNGMKNELDEVKTKVDNIFQVVTS